MNKYQAKKLAKYHKFTKKELYDILTIALNELSDDYWTKPNKINRLFDNGYYFNRCRDWLSYKKGENDDIIEKDIITLRILEVFGKYSKVQLPKKEKQPIKIIGSEKPQL